MKLINLFLVAALMLVTAFANASAPMVKKSAPGYFRFMLGDFEVTALSDGTVNLPMSQILKHTTPEKVDKILAKSFLKNPVETSVNTYLINTGEKLVLIDAGAGGLFGPTLGKLTANLIASGYKPEQVDEIYITHLHNDHIGGVLAGDKAAFPNAILRVDKNDVDFWTSPENLEKASADMKGFFQGPTAALAPYIKAGKLKTFDGNTDLVAGVKALSTRGHTAGHSIYVVESKGQKLVLWGDLIHVQSVQVEKPEITIQYDTDDKAAAAQRKKAFDDAVKNAHIVGASHFSFPGLGYMRAEGKKYIWVPMNYTTIQ